MSTQAWIAAGIFIAVYAAIATEKLDRTIVALAGAALMLIVGLIDQPEAFLHIDLNVIFLLAGMMIIVNIVKRSGLFEWLAISTAKLTGGNTILLLVTLSLVTAVTSAFLDNVTTIMLIGPMTLLIADALRINPIPLLISETMAANIGGTATLIGDPPNILVGSAANLSFLDFLTNLTPVVLIILGVFLLMGTGLFGKKLRRTPPNISALASLQPSRAIKDTYLLWKSLAVLGLVFVAFMFHGMLDIKPATVALGGAAVLLLITQFPPKKKQIDPVETLLAEIDWPTLFFFIGMFIMIGGLEVTGVIGEILGLLRTAAGANALAACMIVMWSAALLTMVTSAVPFVLALIPVISKLGLVPVEPLWWSLALGACLGANGTFIGSAANMVMVGIAKKSSYRIRFGDFVRKGLPVTLASLLLASLYVWVRYFVIPGNPWGTAP